MLGAKIYQEYESLEIKPPVTFGLIGILVGLHIAPAFRSSLNEVCLSARAYDLQRVVMSALTHADDVHLYYNVGSFLVKGVLLEQRMGSETFFAFVAFSVFSSAAIYVALSSLLYDAGCAVGFSAALFAMKVVLNRDHGPEDRASVWGISVAARHAHWLEIVVASYVNPRSSLLGHAAGALAGLLWLSLPDMKKAAPGAFRGATTTPRYAYARGTAPSERVFI
ncbi:hypothetical protein CTAYLR_004958 [Chrysophaeum taylorii]|uniref:Peptidase S54 rhomboid domain-containing protein n=1 Tax=Chrysophaeum taylorii TaxID=2483200 RepID=A0AAD7UPC7_9STRA|nr:hypothetical protein CTAYLR_004958 [Chrysophaeum taylorii]